MLVKVGQGNNTNIDLNTILHHISLTPFTISELQQSVGDALCFVNIMSRAHNHPT